VQSSGNKWEDSLVPLATSHSVKLTTISATPNFCRRLTHFLCQSRGGTHHLWTDADSLPPSTLAPEALTPHLSHHSAASNLFTPYLCGSNHWPYSPTSYPPPSSQYGPASSKTRQSKSWAANFSAEIRGYVIYLPLQCS
jgi:hypothetical protein